LEFVKESRPRFNQKKKGLKLAMASSKKKKKNDRIDLKEKKLKTVRLTRNKFTCPTFQSKKKFFKKGGVNEGSSWSL
jgi:hypothetical protein